MNHKYIICCALVFSIFYSRYCHAQIIINEVCNANVNILMDDDGEYEDWIELYNYSSSTVSLEGWSLSDDSTDADKFNLPAIDMVAGEYKIIFCSAKNRTPVMGINHWETVLHDTSTYKYIVPATTPPADWYLPSFTDTSWTDGNGGFGYGDADDNTIIATGSVSVYYKKTFNVVDTSLLLGAILHQDFDDGFIAYINGVEIARYNMGGSAYTDLSTGDHEAMVYQGFDPTMFVIDRATFKNAIVPGTNVLAVQVHNTSATSSDLTARTWLSVGIASSAILYYTTPSWFVPPAGSGIAIHTNFKLKKVGESVALFNPSNTLIHNLTYPVLDKNHSYGAKPDASIINYIFNTPTPGASNNGAVSFVAYESEPIINTVAGFYPTTTAVSITNTSTTGGQVRYTMDGQTPTPSSTLYTSPITVSTTAVIKAKCFSTTPDYLNSTTSASTFFINDNYIFPVISLTADDIDLYGASGIIDNPYGDDRKQFYIEYFDIDDTQLFEQRAAAKVDGGAGGSRGNPQRSLRIDLDHSVYGDGAINEALLPDKQYVNEYHSFFLRNGSNYWNTMPYKEAFIQRMYAGDEPDLMPNTQNIINGYRPVIVFLNGSYFGVYELREKVNGDFLADNFSANHTDNDVLSVSYFYGGGILRTVEGSDTGYINMVNTITTIPATSSSLFSTAATILDINNFVDYMIAENWSANIDWLYNNMKILRSRSTDNLWKFSIQDLELGFNAWGSPTTDMFQYIEDNSGFTYTDLYQHLMNNTTFRNYFINRYADLMNTQLLPSRTNSILNTMHAEILPEMPRTWVQWEGITMADATSWRISNFNNERNSVSNYLNDRSSEVRNQIESRYGVSEVNITLRVSPPGAGYVKINTAVPTTYPWTGVYFNGIPVTVTAYPNPGYTFSNWNASPFITTATVSTFTNTITTGTTFTANFTGALSTADLNINEINYNSEDSRDAGDWIEIINNSSNPIVLNNYKIQDASPTNIFTIPNSILASGERLVIANDMAAFMSEHPDVTNVVGPFTFGLNNTTDQIVLLNPTGTIVASMTYIDSLPWPRGADGTSRTLELNNPTDAIAIPTNWFDGCIGGSPGIAYTPCHDAIVFSEINYNSDSLFDTDDWIELWNTTSSDINIGNWRFMDKQDTNIYMFPSGTILPANGRIVLVQTGTKFHCEHFASSYMGDFNFNLSGEGDNIRLFDSSGKIQQTVIYDDNDLYGWPISPDGNGYSLELLDPRGKMNEGFNWFAGCYGGSPVAAYTSSCPTVSPSIPIITGVLSVCESNTMEYSVLPGPIGTVYDWVVTGGTILSGIGTHAITVLWDNTGINSISITVTRP